MTFMRHSIHDHRVLWEVFFIKRCAKGQQTDFQTHQKTKNPVVSEFIAEKIEQ